MINDYTPPAIEGSNITIECFIGDTRTNLTIIIFFIFGFVCGCFCQKYKQSILALCKTPKVQSSTEKEAQQDSRTLEMTKNVAYGPVGRSQLTTNNYNIAHV